MGQSTTACVGHPSEGYIWWRFAGIPPHSSRLAVRRALLKLLDGFFLLRVPLLVPVWTVLLLGWITGREGVGLWTGRGGRYPESPVLWIALVGFSLVVASIYVVNQIVDIESDRINHKLFLLPHGIVSVRAAWVLAVLCALAGMALSPLLGVGGIWVFALSIVLGILYNLPPASLKNHALGGVLANSLGHGMLTYLVGWFAAHCGSPVDWALLKVGLISSLSPAFANGAVFLATTIPDADGDRATAKNTFCVQFGQRATAITAFVFCAAAVATAFMMEHNALVMVIPSAVSLVFFAWLAIAGKRQVAYQAFRWPVVLLSVAVFVVVPVFGVMLLTTFLASRLYYRYRFGIEYPTLKSK